MYLDTAPAGEPRTRQLGISAVRTRVFAPSTGYTRDPILERYLTDMCALYGHTFDPDGYAAASRVCYTDMAACLLGDLQPLGGDVDLVLIAHTAPDADPRRSTACYLNEHTPG
ncbi:MAG TPA: hypothetical protein VHC49_01555, partial [Mycobacteriales bacterium]|nr:hypothetical protein [Mycobacteriales bacterium]